MMHRKQLGILLDTVSSVLSVHPQGPCRGASAREVSEFQKISPVGSRSSSPGRRISFDSVDLIRFNTRCEGYECVNDAGTIRRDEFYDETDWFVLRIDRKSCIMFHTRKTSRVRVAPYVGP